MVAQAGSVLDNAGNRPADTIQPEPVVWVER